MMKSELIARVLGIKEDAGVYEISDLRTAKLSKAARKKADALLALLEGDDVDTITSTADAARILQKALYSCYNSGVENFFVVLLDTKHHVMGVKTISTGTVSSSVVAPKGVFREAIKAGATSIIVGHNHPSGDLTPSRDDINTTDRLVKGGGVT